MRKMPKTRRCVCVCVCVMTFSFICVREIFEAGPVDGSKVTEKSLAFKHFEKDFDVYTHTHRDTNMRMCACALVYLHDCAEENTHTHMRARGHHTRNSTRTYARTHTHAQMYMIGLFMHIMSASVCVIRHHKDTFWPASLALDACTSYQRRTPARLMRSSLSPGRFASAFLALNPKP